VSFKGVNNIEVPLIWNEIKKNEMKRYIIIAILLLSSEGFSQDIDAFFSQADAFFKTNVVDGKVAYSKIHNNQEALKEVLELAEGISINKSEASSYQAFWINAYNLSVIKGIVDNYPLESPLDKSGFFDEIKFALAGQKITLNDIENKLLRAQFKDARFHFVLVCGAIGCPPLINEAYLPNSLEAQLLKQTKLALNGDYFIKVNAKKKRIEGSQILEWYKEDFTRDGKKEVDFINKYRTEKIPENYKISYFPYNWKLNKL